MSKELFESFEEKKLAFIVANLEYDSKLYVFSYLCCFCKRYYEEKLESLEILNSTELKIKCCYCESDLSLKKTYEIRKSYFYLDKFTVR